MYTLYCCQRHIYFPAGEKAIFNSLEEIRATLADYHSADWEEEKDIKNLSLTELLDYGEWEVHDLQGNQI